LPRSQWRNPLSQARAKGVTWGRRRKAWVTGSGLLLITTLVVAALSASPAWQYAAGGLVLKVNREYKVLVVSVRQIPGYMDAMVMPLPVRNASQLQRLRPGMMIDFTLVVDHDSPYVENIRVRRFESLEKDPREACRLAILERFLAKPTASDGVLMTGQHVPDFALSDQNGRRVALSQFAGKVVAVDFVYTRCPLPNFCFRLSTNFWNIQRRFANQLGRNLILLTVTLDPLNDQQEALTKYASIWKADPASWHFLTRPSAEVKRVTSMFGVDYWQDEGMMTHSLHTVIIDRRGNLVANIEGNEFTAKQLGDFVETVLNEIPNSSHPAGSVALAKAWTGR
jgi:protein SCO1